VTLLQESLGVDDAQRAVVRERVAARRARGHDTGAGSVLLGVLVGIFAAELAAPDRSAPDLRGCWRALRRLGSERLRRQGLARAND
jgi:hypothetical protein